MDQLDKLAPGFEDMYDHKVTEMKCLLLKYVEQLQGSEQVLPVTTAANTHAQYI